MSKKFYAVAFGLVLCSVSLVAKAETALEVQSRCKDVANAKVGAKIGGEQRISFLTNHDTGFCWGAFAAIQAFSAYTADDGLKYCASADTTRFQDIKIFSKFVDDHPEYSHRDFVEVARQALMSAFPCSAAVAAPLTLAPTSNIVLVCSYPRMMNPRTLQLYDVADTVRFAGSSGAEIDGADGVPLRYTVKETTTQLLLTPTAGTAVISEFNSKSIVIDRATGQLRRFPTPNDQEENVGSCIPQKAKAKFWNYHPIRPRIASRATDRSFIAFATRAVPGRADRPELTERPKFTHKRTKHERKIGKPVSENPPDDGSRTFFHSDIVFRIQNPANLALAEAASPS